jgi:hypothetical protein
MYVGSKNSTYNNKLNHNYLNLNYGILPKYKQIYYLNNISKTKEYNSTKSIKFLQDLKRYDFSIESYEKINMYVDSTLQKYPVIPDYRHALVILERDLLELSHIIVESNISNNDFIITLKEFIEKEKMYKNSKQIISYYLDSMEITISVVQNLRKSLLKIKNKEIYNEYSKLFEYFFEEIF